MSLQIMWTKNWCLFTELSYKSKLYAQVYDNYLRTYQKVKLNVCFKNLKEINKNCLQKKEFIDMITWIHNSFKKSDKKNKSWENSLFNAF